MDRQDQFNKIQKSYRDKFLQLLDGLESEYDRKMEKAMERIRKIAIDYAGSDGVLDKSELDKLKQEINAISYSLTSEYKDLLDEKIRETLEIAVTGQDVATKKVLVAMKDGGVISPSVYNAAVNGGNGQPSALIGVRYGNGVIEELRNKVWQHRWEDGKKLSDRIWNINSYTKQGLQDMIEQSVNQGRKATDFAKSTEIFLKESVPNWTTGIKPSRTGRGSVKYNALRLARTETNQAYHRMQHRGAEESIITKGVKWNLSASHPTYSPSYSYKGYNEICDYRAKADHHGLGPGVYPAKADEIPFDHPNGFCYKTYVLLEGKKLINKLNQKYAA